MASCHNELAEFCFTRGLWDAAREGLFSANTRIQRAAIEALANMSFCSGAVQRLLSPQGDGDLTVFFAFAQNPEDLPAQMAATGALAMFAGRSREAALRVGDFRVRQGGEGEGEGEGEGAGEPEAKRPAARADDRTVPGELLLRALMAHQELDEQVRIRCHSALYNIAAARAALAEGGRGG